MRNVKPVYLMYEEGVEAFQVRAVPDALRTILELAGVWGKIEVRNYGV